MKKILFLLPLAGILLNLSIAIADNRPPFEPRRWPAVPLLDDCYATWPYVEEFIKRCECKNAYTICVYFDRLRYNPFDPDFAPPAAPDGSACEDNSPRPYQYVNCPESYSRCLGEDRFWR